MKRFSKMLAMGLALAMTFGMTVSAAYSPEAIAAAEETAQKVAEQVKIPEGATTYVGDKDVDWQPYVGKIWSGATYLDVTGYAEGEKGTKRVKDTVGGSLAADQQMKGEPKVLGAVEVYLGGYADYEDLEAGVRFAITVPGGVQPNTKYVFLHRNNAGGWESILGSVDGDAVYLTLHSYSPIVIVAQEYEKKVNPGGPGSVGGTTAPTANTDSTPVSPKTGEAMPVSVIVTLVCLAGAAVCAKKVRYNR